MVRPDLVSKWVQDGSWANRPFIDVARETIKKYAGKEMMVDGDKRFTFTQMDQMSDNLAKNLAQLGLKKGEVVSVELPNCYQLSVIHLAVAKLGCVLNLIVPIYRDAEVSFILGQLKSAVMIVPAAHRGFDLLDMVRRLKPGLPKLRHTLAVGETSAGDVLSLDKMLREAPSGPLPAVDIDPMAVRAVIFTSGTTAEPKGVQHNHNNMLCAIRDHIKVRGFTDRDVYLSALPVCHQMGLNWAMDAPYIVGYRVVLQDRWDAETALRLIEKERCTFTVLVPTMLLSVLDVPSARKFDTNSLRYCECTGAPVAEYLVRRAWSELGWRRTFRSYGMSEIPGISQVPAGAPLDEVQAKGATTDGKITEILEPKLVDANRKALRLDQEGELALRGPHVFIGYTNPKLNQDAFDEDGFYYTGDLARISPDGYLEITGRAKDIIIRGGENISAKEIEDLLYKHPKVAEVAVVAMPDVRMGEKVCAYVKLKESARAAGLSLEEVTGFLLAQGLSTRKLPEHLETIAEFPRSSIGKIIKAELRKDITRKVGLRPVRGA